MVIVGIIGYSLWNRLNDLNNRLVMSVVLINVSNGRIYNYVDVFSMFVLGIFIVICCLIFIGIGECNISCCVFGVSVWEIMLVL